MIKTLVVKDLETLAGLQAKDKSGFRGHIVVQVKDNQIQTYSKKSLECDFFGEQGEVCVKARILWELSGLRH